MSERAEEAVIGSILQRPELIASAELTLDDFTDTRRLIWMAMTSLARHGKPIDIFSVSELIQGGEALEKQLATYCVRVMDCASPDNFGCYVEMVRDSTRKAMAKDIAQRLLTRIDSEGLEVINDAIADLMKLNATRQPYEWTLDQAVDAAFDLIEAARERGSPVEMTTGLQDLDAALGGWHRKDLTVIGARPAIGKTALLLNLADRCQAPCGIISAEQPHEQVGMRFLAMTGRVALQVLRTARMLEDEYSRLLKSRAALESRLLWINDRSAPQLAEVIQQARKWRFECGMRVLFIDYIQRIRYQADANIPRHEQIMEVTMALKDLARELDIPVITLAQVNREVEKRQDKRPFMGDIKDSGSIEQEADQVLTLYRDDVYNPDSPDKGIAEINVCKNRHGPVGCIRVAWLGEFLRFENLFVGNP